MSRKITITPTTFTRFIRGQRRRQDAIGDFARDWLSDRRHTPPRKPRGQVDWARMVLYLESRNASFAAIEAARRAWNEWKRCTIVQKRGQVV
jgi:hypothetical protein